MKLLLALKLKIAGALSKPITYLIGIVTTTFNLAMDQGIVEDLLFMFALMVVATLGDLATGALKASIKKEYTSKKGRKSYPKMLVMYLVFGVFAISVIISNNFNEVYYLFFNTATWIYVSAAISNELYSMVENGEELGLPGAKKLKEMIDNLPSTIMKKGGK